MKQMPYKPSLNLLLFIEFINTRGGPSTGKLSCNIFITYNALNIISLALSWVAYTLRVQATMQKYRFNETCTVLGSVYLISTINFSKKYRFNQTCTVLGSVYLCKKHCFNQTCTVLGSVYLMSTNNFSKKYQVACMWSLHQLNASCHVM